LLVDDSGDGWDYEPETNTLILWYADVKTGMTTSDGKANAGVYCMGDLNIVLEDENKIDLSQAEPMEDSSAAISVEGDLTIRGEGSLKAIGGRAGTVSVGVHATGTISINANVHAAATKTDDSRAFAVAAVKGLSIGKLNNAVIMPVKALDGSTIWTVADAEGKPATSVQTAVKQPDAPGYVPVEKPTKQDSYMTDAYSDLESGAWYHEAVNYVLKEGLMNGVGGGKFDPYGTTNRAMIVTILWRLEGEPSVGSADFDDVAEDVWYSDAVNWAASEGIVEGYGNNKFGPMDAITREQLAAILWRYAKSEGQDVSVGENTNILSYADAFTVSDWAYAPLQWACGAGVVNGKDGALVPQGVAFRVETAQMLLNFLR